MLCDMKNKVILSVKDNLVDTIAEFIDPALALACKHWGFNFSREMHHKFKNSQINLLLCTTIAQHRHEGGHWHWRIDFKGKRPQEPLGYVGRTNYLRGSWWTCCWTNSLTVMRMFIQNLSTMDAMPSLRGQAPSWSLSTIVWRRGDQQLKDEEDTHCAISTWPKQCCPRSTRGKLRRPKREGLVYKSVGT
jgi:hypothetical protein